MLKYFIILIIFIVIIYISWLSANPWKYEMTKYNIYKYINRDYILKNSLITKENINYDKLIYPFVIKPEYCNGANNGVSLIKTRYELDLYLEKSFDKSYIIQDYYYPKYEVGILYEKFPFNNKGKIISIILKNKNNINKWEPLKCKNINNNTTIICDNRYDINTPELENTINNICSNIPNFYVGRFDIGFNNFDDLKKGKNFKIYELNGVMGFDLRFNYDKDNILSYINKTLLLLRWIIKRLIIGFLNVLFFNTNIIDLIKNNKNRYNDMLRCKNYEIYLQPSSA